MLIHLTAYDGIGLVHWHARHWDESSGAFIRTAAGSYPDPGLDDPRDQLDHLAQQIADAFGYQSGPH